MTKNIEDNLYDTADLFKVFGDSTRLRILYTLREKTCSVNELSESLNMNQSAISHQLRTLKDNKLIKCVRSGKNIHYSLADDHVLQIINQGLEHIQE